MHRDDEREWAQLREARLVAGRQSFTDRPETVPSRRGRQRARDLARRVHSGFCPTHSEARRRTSTTKRSHGPSAQGQFVTKCLRRSSPLAGVGASRDHAANLDQARTMFHRCRRSCAGDLRRAKRGSNGRGCSVRRLPPDWAAYFAWKPSAQFQWSSGCSNMSCADPSRSRLMPVHAMCNFAAKRTVWICSTTEHFD